MAEPVVAIQSGLVRGVVESHEDGFNYYAFKGIPYAQPPTGELRFADPIPVGNWNGVRDAKDYGPICAQNDHMFTKRLSHGEDCLHLNVYTSVINQPNVKKAVMVWIHGGGFICGSADDMMYGPEYLIRKDIVLVTINYRVGVFGFLDLEDEIAPGNQGLKDQVLALHWIHQNIQVFGGDSNNVTVLGESAGAASVHYLTLSPLALGLIHKAILQSGAVYNSWAAKHEPRKNAIKLCCILGKELQDSKAIVEFLRTVDAQKLLEAQDYLRITEDWLPFGPGVDANSSKPFMPVNSTVAADQGVHIPCIVGHTGREGIFFMPDMQKEELLRSIEDILEYTLNITAAGVLKRHNLNANQLRRLYYKGEKVSDENLDKFVRVFGDFHFNEGIHKFVKTQARQSSAPTYMYKFCYDTIDSFCKLFKTNRFAGAGHTDELKYLFKSRMYNETKYGHLKNGTRSYEMMKQMTEMWTNFAKYGRPTLTTSELIPVHWLPIDDGTLLRYMNIDEDMTMQYTVNIAQKYLSASTIKVEQ